MSVVKYWHRSFLEERASIGLSFFRIFVALATGLHVIPAFFALPDNFSASALKLHDYSFFPLWTLRWVAQSPDWLIELFVKLFIIFWFGFLVGIRTQLCGIGMTLCCYYFYALNSFHIGTLSWDILLVTLFLMCITPYPGDYFSIDALNSKHRQPWARPRPYFIQRLLQIQIASTYFYTALHKITGEGDWLTGNPIHALVNYPQAGVTKNFLFKEWMAVHPQFCYVLGIIVVAVELLMPLLLFYPKTRRSGIILGFVFHVTLILTLDVPAIFFFLYPAQLLLFIHPDAVLRWIESIRRRQVPMTLLYDGDCGFCRRWVERFMVMDIFGRLTFKPMADAGHEMVLVDGETRWGGFRAFRRLCLQLPMLYPLVLFVYFPGAVWVGDWGYRFVARNRHLFSGLKACGNNSCSRSL